MKGVQAGSKDITELPKRANQVPTRIRKNTTREYLKGAQSESGKEIANVSGADGVPCVTLNLNSSRASQSDLTNTQETTYQK